MNKKDQTSNNDQVVKLEERKNEAVNEVTAEPKKMSFEEMRIYFERKAVINRQLSQMEAKKTQVFEALNFVKEGGEDEDELDRFSFTVSKGYKDDVFNSKNRLVLTEVLNALLIALDAKIEQLKSKLLE